MNANSLEKTSGTNPEVLPAGRIAKKPLETISGYFLIGFLLLLAGCSPPKERLEKMTGLAQGSYYAIRYYTGNPKLYAAELQTRIDSLLTAFDLCASLWNERSEICRVNRNEDFRPSRMFCDMFTKAQSVSEQTDGVFDITVGPLAKAYGFGAEKKNGRTLSDEELIEILACTGWDKVRLEDGKIVKDHPGIQLDFNAIAQGYCADLVGGFLLQQGVERYLVDIGGEICSKGTKENGAPWIVGIEKPAADASSQRNILSKLTIRDQALVTSGNYRKYFEENGKRFSHTLHPKTGRPVRHNLLSATVLCQECWEADAIATACMVMGKDSAIRFAGNYPGRYELFLIYTDPIDGSDSTVLKAWHTENFPLIAE